MSTQTPQQHFWRDAALPFAETRRSTDSRACYRPHTHPTFSVGVVDAGTSVFTSQGRSVHLAAGSLVAVPAECLHACNPTPGERWSYQMLYLDAAWVDDALKHAGAPPSPPHALVVRDAQAYEAFCALNDLLFSSATAAAKAAALREFLVRGAWRAGEALTLAQGPAAASLAHAQALLHARYAEPLPLVTLAEAAGMTPRALVRAFRAATGLTPHAYQLNLRINAARGLLRAGHAPAAVAHDLGFYDQSHFQNAFRERTATTPGHYRR